MKKIEIPNASLTAFTLSATAIPSTPIRGTISQSAEGQITFVQTLATPRSCGSERLYSGSLLSLVQKKNGELVAYTKCANLLGVDDPKAYTAALAQEMKQIFGIVRQIKEAKRKA